MAAYGFTPAVKALQIRLPMCFGAHREFFLYMVFLMAVPALILDPHMKRALDAGFAAIFEVADPLFFRFRRGGFDDH